MEEMDAADLEWWQKKERQKKGGSEPPEPPPTPRVRDSTKAARNVLANLNAKYPNGKGFDPREALNYQKALAVLKEEKAAGRWDDPDDLIAIGEWTLPTLPRQMSVNDTLVVAFVGLLVAAVVAVIASIFFLVQKRVGWFNVARRVWARKGTIVFIAVIATLLLPPWTVRTHSYHSVDDYLVEWHVLFAPPHNGTINLGVLFVEEAVIGVIAVGVYLLSLKKRGTE